MIGLSLIDYLLKKEIDILAFVRKNSTNKNLLPKSERLKVVECDLEELENYSTTDISYDVMYHLAWDGTRGNTRNDVFLQNANTPAIGVLLNRGKRHSMSNYRGSIPSWGGVARSAGVGAMEI